MPFAGFDDWDECIVTMTDEEGHDQDAAERICGALQAEAKNENGDVSELRQALERGRGLIADVSVDLNSAVDRPAADSQWVMFKSVDDAPGEHDTQIDAPMLFKADESADAREEKRIAYAPAMVPRDIDKEGDVAPTHVVERAAHDYLKSGGGVDADHDLVDGKGHPVESWIEPDAREWELPDGTTKEYPAGTWMLGIEWEAETWKRIKEGDLEGLSIYGMADHVPLARSVGKDDTDPCWDGYTMVGTDENGDPRCVPDDDVDDVDFDKAVVMDGSGPPADGGTHKSDSAESNGQSHQMTDDNDSDTGGTTDGPTVKDVSEEVDALKSEVSSISETVATIKEELTAGPEGKADAADKIAQVAEDLAAMDGVGTPTGEIEQGLMDLLGMSESADEEKEDGDEMDDDEDDEEKADETAKSDGDPNFEKSAGSGGESPGSTPGAAEESGGTSGIPSYRALAEEAAGEE